ncbi:ST1D1 Sulfotransferase, partial [Crypturellus soui]|nr:ST1D1 Sulfotransferase [Crypturellus soui]
RALKAAMGREDIVREELGILHGMPIYKPFIKTWPQVEAFQARPDDLLICTYPKSGEWLWWVWGWGGRNRVLVAVNPSCHAAGTTWLSEILDMLYHDGNVEKCKRDAIFNRVPFLEMNMPDMPNGIELLAKMPSPRLVKTHLPVQLLPNSFWEQDCKVIYVARNPKDVAISYYYFHQMAKMHPDPGTMQEFLQNFMAGKVVYGSWYSHVKDWWEKRKDKRLLYLFYEDMKQEPQREVRKIARFLGKKVPESMVEKIVHHTSFQEMKKNPAANYETLPDWVMDHSLSPFLRKGIAGDWKNHFTVAQNECFNKHYKEQMKDSDLCFHMEL